MPLILAFRKLRQEDCEFEASQAYKVSSRPACVIKRDPASKNKTKTHGGDVTIYL
jgi:hypothetical protein